MLNIIYFDGSYPQSTRHMHAAFVCGEDKRARFTDFNGDSSTHSEWLALCAALEYAGEKKLRNLIMVGDNMAVINAMKKGGNVKEEFRGYRRFATDIGQELNVLSYYWIHSDDNPAGQHIRDLQLKGRLPLPGVFG